VPAYHNPATLLPYFCNGPRGIIYIPGIHFAIYFMTSATISGYEIKSDSTAAAWPADTGDATRASSAALMA
jgi:hypothetical protein